MARLTSHAVQRGRERVGINARAMTRLATRAWQTGQAPEAFAGSFRRFLDTLTARDGARVRVHGEHVYIFDAHEDRVITIYHVPAKFRSLLRRMRERES